MKLIVTATIIARPDTTALLQQALLTLVRATRLEPGCLRYDLLENLQDPAYFAMYEEWKDTTTFEAHQQTAHLRHYAEQATPLLAEPMTVQVFRTVGPE